MDEEMLTAVKSWSELNFDMFFPQLSAIPATLADERHIQKLVNIVMEQY